MSKLKNKDIINNAMLSYGVWIINGLLVIGLFGFYQKFIVVEKTRAQALRRDVALYEESRRLLKEREDLLAAWQPYQSKLDDFFFTKDHLVKWLEFLEREARAHRLGFEVSSLDEESVGNPPRLRVALRGALSDTIQFLRAVETGPYGIGVKEGVIRKGASSDLPAEQAGERITQLTFLLYGASS